jgi:NDP-sugar pyrophosphorylase family protein
MEAVVLAGGRGTRLLPLTAEIPKPLVTIDDRPILEILLNRLNRCGVTKVRLAVNHLAHLIMAAVGNGERFGLKVTYQHESTPLSTVGPVKAMRSLPNDFLVVNGDILTDLDFAELFDHHLKSGACLTVAVHERSNLIDYGVIEIDPDGMVSTFEEKPRSRLTVSMGVYVFSRRVLKWVPTDRPFGFDQLMLCLLDEGERISAYRYEGYWLDIGRPDDYRRAQEDIRRIKKLFD